MKRFTKSLFLSLFITLSGMASEQLLLVVSDDFNATAGRMVRYALHDGVYIRQGNSIPVNLGRSGMGWGVGEKGFAHPQSDPVKKEGDGRAPAGIFPVLGSFGYAEQIQSDLPYQQATEKLICVDDAASNDYNKIIMLDEKKRPGSFEWMRREDGLYEIGLVVGHNRERLRGRGSCIFIHVQKEKGSPTAGCTSMAKEGLAELVAWLDGAKRPVLVQIPRSYCPQAEALYPGIACPSDDPADF
jgi:L,D-peptidoglycan transpeptidase YkuD (ErfK/YbiS/YcfS/YnhG family)